MVVLAVIGEHDRALHPLGSIPPRRMKQTPMEKEHIPAAKLEIHGRIKQGLVIFEVLAQEKRRIETASVEGLTVRSGQHP